MMNVQKTFLWCFTGFVGLLVVAMLSACEPVEEEEPGLPECPVADIDWPYPEAAAVKCYIQLECDRL